MWGTLCFQTFVSSTPHNIRRLPYPCKKRAHLSGLSSPSSFLDNEESCHGRVWAEPARPHPPLLRHFQLDHTAMGCFIVVNNTRSSVSQAARGILECKELDHWSLCSWLYGVCAPFILDTSQTYKTCILRDLCNMHVSRPFYRSNKFRFEWKLPPIKKKTDLLFPNGGKFYREELTYLITWLHQ